MTDPVRNILIGTGNSGKGDELRALLAMHGLPEILLLTPSELPAPLPPVEEVGETFLDNARLKATVYAQASGLPTLADDSGLCVDALGGEPGVYSARWAGPGDGDRNRALLDRLQGVADPDRGARFVCAACMALPDGTVVTAEAECWGVILQSPQGRGGFGYDPLFWLPEQGKTMAELAGAQKNALSHRGKAIAALVPGLLSLLGTMSGETE